MRPPLLALALAALAFLAAPAHAAPRARGPLTVCPVGCRFAAPQQALRAAAPGDEIRVLPGRYRGRLVIAKRVALQGVGAPVLDGGGTGSVVRIVAAGARLEGFVVRGSGSSHDSEDTAVILQAPRVVVAANRVEDALFGIYVKEAPGSLVKGNRITGKDLPMGRRGDGIRVWYSPGTAILANSVSRTRDGLIWFSHRTTVAGNRFSGARYGLHVMYSNACVVERNAFSDSSVGAYFMFGRGLRLVGNLTRGNRGPSGFGFGLREMQAVRARANLAADNSVGLYLSGFSRDTGATNVFDTNVLAYNDVGVSSDVELPGNVFTGNSFLDNTRQVSAAGGETLEAIRWSAAGRGNYWSDYNGYDADGDGLGDVVYAPRRALERLADAHPSLALLHLSPAATAIDQAASAFPLFASGKQLVDRHPLVRPVAAPELPHVVASAGPLAASAAGLMALALAGAGLALAGGRSRRRLAFAAAVPTAGGEPVPPPPAARVVTGDGFRSPAPEPAALVEAIGISKAYADARVLDGLGFTLRPGEALALWGPNGAGKTTVLRCLLGLVRCDGSVRIAGCDLHSERKQALRAVGYVAQEPAFHDQLTVAETLALYAELRDAPPEAVAAAVEMTGLADHAGKPVRALSGGMRRKLAIATATLGDPPLLLLDEPTANLDERSRRNVIDLLARLKRGGKALILAAHHAEEVERLADRVLLLAPGLPAREAPVSALRGTRLLLRVPEHLRDRATRTLRELGFAVEDLDDQLAVEVEPGRKTVPLIALGDAGVDVEDFRLEGRL